jgi:hypothetical protein
MYELPREGCSHCYGRGFVGHVDHKEIVLCRCLTNSKVVHNQGPVRPMSDEYFKEMISKAKVVYNIKENKDEVVNKDIKDKD